jgi:5-methylcytosine-specific restriction endonuclease McrA
MFIRNCLDCGKEMSYSKKWILNRAIKNNSVCVPCSKKGEKHPFYGKTHSGEHCRKISENMKGNKNNLGNKHSEETLRKMSENMKGEKNPSYGKTPSEETRRNISIGNGGSGKLDQKWPGLRAWANRVKERDEYVCQHCYYDGLPEEMDAHHIVPKSKFPQYAYDLDNGQTLCKQCHRIEHYKRPTI